MSDHTPTTAPAPVLTPDTLSDDMIRQMIHEANQAYTRASADVRAMEAPNEPPRQSMFAAGNAAYCETIRSYLSQAGVTSTQNEALRREVARLTEDRERIEWLERQGAGPFKFTLAISRQDGKPAWALFNTDVTGWGEGPTVREAIDAARREG